MRKLEKKFVHKVASIEGLPEFVLSFVILIIILLLVFSKYHWIHVETTNVEFLCKNFTEVLGSIVKCLNVFFSSLLAWLTKMLMKFLLQRIMNVAVRTWNEFLSICRIVSSFQDKKAVFCLVYT